jgi:hypothetical protein
VSTAIACGDNTPGQITVIVPSIWQSQIGEMVRLTPYAGINVVSTLADAGRDAIVIDIDNDATMASAESYRLDPLPAQPQGQAVHAGDLMGAQYGFAHAMENLGFRFRHPRDTFVPSVPVLDVAAASFGVVHRPDMKVRGMHMHTLHPIEGYFAVWESGDDRVEDFRQIVDWVVKNRGNLVEYFGLADIREADRLADWKSHTKKLLDVAHSRGVRVGLGMQLFGGADLQQSYHLSDNMTTLTLAQELALRLPPIVDGLPFDIYNLSFGEFFGEEPQKFVDSVNVVATELRKSAPGAELHATIHVGGNLRVNYMGQNVSYYQLIKFADPQIIPDIHTTMYYNLFEDTGGAYQLENFFEQRQYLVDRRCANQRASYFPENAYWVSFDISVPQFAPLYVRSRWLDMKKLRQSLAPPCKQLDEHLIFSSGWEWNYWLNDYTVLRNSYELADSPQAAIAHAYGSDLGSDAAALVAELADVQADNLIVKRLTPYLASRDLSADLGDKLGIVSQPDRVTFAELTNLNAADRSALQSQFLDPLDAYGNQLDEFATRFASLTIPSSRWSNEIRDGIDIDRARVRFMSAVYRTQLAYLAGDTIETEHNKALAALIDATAIVKRRHRDLHDGRPRIREKGPNATYYAYGYLFMADTLCFWQRELREMETQIGVFSGSIPSCLL